MVFGFYEGGASPSGDFGRGHVAIDFAVGGGTTTLRGVKSHSGEQDLESRQL